MTFNETRLAIEQRFIALFTAAPIAFENKSGPASVEAARKEFAPWVRLTIRNGDSFTAAIEGNGRVLEEHIGRVWVQVFVKENTGAAVATQLADTAADAFRNAQFNGIRCYTPQVQIAGNDGNGWFMVTVSVPFRRFS